MWDFIMQILAELNIVSGVVGAYDSAIAVLSSFSWLVSLVSFLLKKEKIFNVDEMLDATFFKKKRKIKASEIMLVLDSLLLVVNVVKLFTNIPTEFYTGLLILSIVAFVATVISALVKVALFLICFITVFVALFQVEIGGAIALLIMMVFIVLTVGVDLFRAVMNFDEILSILRALPR